ncbi:MAG: hypothetical protein CM1200mP1_07490 [Candidatus Neomarinimicrobiota bacterium]|nr:MAG: hypothetical protein CM1200mP1_07490 [Candidatus Neomarinimicrobiota bacterium]
MTIMGTVHKTGLALLLLMSTALFTWNLPNGDPKASGLMIFGMIGGFIVALITAFKPHMHSTLYQFMHYFKDLLWEEYQNFLKQCILEL